MIYFTRQEQRIAILLAILILLGIGLTLAKRFQPGWVMRLSMGEPDFDVVEEEVSTQPEYDRDIAAAKSNQAAASTQDIKPPNESGALNMSHQRASGDIRININTASKEELITLPGIGPVLAQRIIDYRQKYGKFGSIREITGVSGIGDVTLRKFMDNITLGNDDGTK